MQQPELNSFTSSSSTSLGRWTLIKHLGTGATSQVFLAVDHNTEEQAAIKIFTAAPKTSKQLLQTEASILQTLTHSNILCFIESYESIEFYDVVTGRVIDVCALVMEYAPNGEFFDLLQEVGRLSEDHTRFYYWQLMDSIAHMHENKIAHRDIKLENILLDTQNSIKIADFGYSTTFTKDKMLKQAVGTTVYFPPEIHAGQAYSGESADIFASGIILFTMIAGHMPFSSAAATDKIYSLFLKNQQDTFWTFHERMIQRKCKDFQFSEDFKSLMSSIFEADPTKRATMDDILAHPWMEVKEYTQDMVNEL